MHVFGLHLDLNSLLQFVFTALLAAVGFLYLVKNTASKYFEVDGNFEAGRTMPGVPVGYTCIVCGKPGNKKCSRCKSARYCSQGCQSRDWSAGHRNKCKNLQSSYTLGSPQTRSTGGSKPTGIALVPAGKDATTVIMQTKKILFPHDEFVKLFNWNMAGFPPCGLINCGNSCFANVVLQCLSFTRPLVAYLLEKGHRRECRFNDWCFLCELQLHVERASQSQHPFSPLSILSRLPNLGGDLGYGRQEDAHEFMRFAIDTMQSVCLNEFGGEKAVHPSSQETTLVQHIFGGHLQSQVICTKCDKVSNQYENMMDLTVEIHGDASSLEECLNQYTAKEWLHGENMYKCDGCNDYVKAWKRLTVKQAPNILTIALKRFQSGRFGKLNKRVTFPETLDLSPYMSEAGDGSDVYKLYAVVVHLDMLNASYFGHYICYTKDFHGSWHRIDDCKVANVDLDEVLSQGAYMLLYSRVSARPSCLKSTEHAEEVKHQKENVKGEPYLKEHAENSSITASVGPTCTSELLTSGGFPISIVKELSGTDHTESETKGQPEHFDAVSSSSNASTSWESSRHERGSFLTSNSEVVKEVTESIDVNNTWSSSQAKPENSKWEEELSVPDNNGAVKERVGNGTVYNSESCMPISVDCFREKEGEVAREYTEDKNVLNYKSSSGVEKVTEVYGNGHATAKDTCSPRKVVRHLVSNSFTFTDKISPKTNNLKHELHYIASVEDRNGTREK